MQEKRHAIANQWLDTCDDCLLEKPEGVCATGLGHVHQTRHTHARMVGDLTGSVVETQDALGHKNAATTRVYLQRVAVKRDKHSSRIAERLGSEGLRL